MERKKYFIIIVLFFSVISLRSETYKELIYQSYIRNDISIWIGVMNKMQAENLPSDEFQAELLNYEYGYVGYCIGVEKDDEAEKYLGLARKRMEKLEKRGWNPSMINAYEAAFYGFEIGLNSFKAPFVGPSSMSAAKAALQLDPENWMAYVQYGNVQFYMPSVFGGSKSEALEYYSKAKALLEKELQNNLRDWNYLNLLTLIGQSYEKMGKDDDARKTYEFILKTEPGFDWVKNELYPQLINKQ
jgi:tetratricopeptide (TPR) repeat protein